jgi:HSP20 family protein
MKWTNLPARKVTTLLDEFEAMHKRITERAFEIFRDRGARVGAALDDWLTAERQTVWKPAIEVYERDRQIFIEAAVAGVEPRQLDIQATPTSLLIKADLTHTHTPDKGTVHVCEFQSGHLFRLVPLPAEIDPNAVKAEYRNGLLRVSAAIAAEQRAKKVEIRAA